MFDDCSKQVVSSFKRLFVRNEKHDSLTEFCKCFIYTLGNQYAELFDENTQAESAETLNTTVDPPNVKCNEESSEGYATDESMKITNFIIKKSEQYLQTQKAQLMLSGIYELRTLKDSKIDGKDVSYALIQNAISNAKHRPGQILTNGSIINHTKINSEGAAPSSWNQFKNNSIISFDEALFLQKALGSMTNLTDADSVQRSEISTIFASSLLSIPDSLFFKLKQEVDYQCQMMMETGKLLDSFRKKLEFHGSRAHVDAERLMLLGSYRHDQLMMRLRDCYYNNLDKNTAVLGSVRLSELQTSLTAKNGKHSEWFICIVSCGEQIFASEPVTAPYNWIRFEEEFSFENFSWDSIIDVSIYSMKISKSGTLKKLLNKRRKQRNCQSKRLLYKDLRTYDLVECNVRSSMFTLCAEAKVQMNNFDCTGNVNLQNAAGSPLEDKLYMKANVEELRFTGDNSGFLTVGVEKGENFTWSRRWCVLDGTKLRLWNYPMDEEFVQPLAVLDLKETCSLTANLTLRSICPKPRTLQLELGSPPKRYFFSADTAEDLKTWKNAFDEVTVCLKGWNLLTFLKD